MLSVRPRQSRLSFVTKGCRLRDAQNPRDLSEAARRTVCQTRRAPGFPTPCRNSDRLLFDVAPPRAGHPAYPWLHFAWRLAREPRTNLTRVAFGGGDQNV